MKRIRLLVAALVGAAAVALVGGIAYATNQSSAETISACARLGDGALRAVPEGDSCRSTERALSWPAEGIRGFRIIQHTQTGREVVVDARGTGDLGFPGDGETETELFSFTLPPGQYFVGVTIGAGKSSGRGSLVCYVRTEGSDTVTSFMRVALGTDPGYADHATVHSDGILNWAGGGSGRLVCLQDARDPERLSGPDPVVFYATVTATKLARATLTRMPSGAVVELP